MISLEIHGKIEKKDVVLNPLSNSNDLEFWMNSNTTKSFLIQEELSKDFEFSPIRLRFRILKGNNIFYSYDLLLKIN